MKPQRTILFNVFFSACFHSSTPPSSPKKCIVVFFNLFPYILQIQHFHRIPLTQRSTSTSHRHRSQPRCWLSRRCRHHCLQSKPTMTAPMKWLNHRRFTWNRYIPRMNCTNRRRMLRVLVSYALKDLHCYKTHTSLRKPLDVLEIVRVLCAARRRVLELYNKADLFEFFTIAARI